MKNICLLLLVGTLLMAGCSPAQAESAVLEGKVFVGPLSPVEQVESPQPTVPPEVYTSRGLQIYTENGKTLVKEISFNPDGSYQIPLAPGDYLVQLKPTGIDRADELPAKITLLEGKTLKLDLHIDTGIR
ncbi:MAG: hypothetical protein HGA53_01625 [Anaerolineaceae bacterium]|nr:hypothetical protein [Anaerolineaceae bacterium]